MFKGGVLITPVDPVENPGKHFKLDDCACVQCVANRETQSHTPVGTQFQCFLAPQGPLELSAANPGPFTISSTELSTAVVIRDLVLSLALLDTVR